MKRISWMIWAWGFVLWGFGACVPAAKGSRSEVYVNTRPTVAIDSVADVPYRTVEDSVLTLTLYSLKGDTTDRKPVLVYIHGGSWVHGNKSWIWRDYRQALTEAFLRAHYTVITVDYRLADGRRRDAVTELEDCQQALNWIRRHADAYHLDIRRMGLWGTSAGAHLALVLASSRGAQPPFRFVLDDYGPTDLDRLFRTDLSPWVVSLVKIVKPQLVAKRQLMLQVFSKGNTTRLSPLRRIHKGMPPILISYGDADEVVPVQQAYDLAKALKAKGIPYRLRIYSGEKHGLKTLTVSQVREFAKGAVAFADRYNPR